MSASDAADGGGGVFTRRRVREQLVERPAKATADADADGVSDVEELLAGTDPNDATNGAGPVLEAALPPLGAAPIASVEPVAVALEPTVLVAPSTPDGTAIGITLEGVTLEGITLDTAPSHFGVDLSVGGIGMTTTIADALGVVSPAGATTSVAPADTTYSGNLGAMPRFGLIAAEGDGTSTTANPDGTVTTTVITTTENEKGTTKKTETTTEGNGTLVVETTIETNEADGDTVTITTTDTYKEGYGGKWEKETSTAEASGTNNGQPFEWRKQTYPPGNTYDTGEGDTLPAELAPVVEQLIASGSDPTTTTPAGGGLDDGGAEPITADAVTGTTMLGVIVKPGVVDEGYELEVIGEGDPTTRLIVGGGDGADPRDPTFSGGETITADELSGPLPTNSNPNSSTVDETVSPWTPVGEAGSVGTIQQVAEPATPEPVAAVFVAPELIVAEPVFGAGAALPGLEPEVAIATALPDGTAIGGGLDGLTVGSITVDTGANHYGVDTAVGGVIPTTIADVLNVAGTTGTITPAPASTTGSGNLGPLPGTELYGAEAGGGTSGGSGGGGVVDAVVDGVKGVVDTVVTTVTEVVDDVVEVVDDVVEWVGNVKDWIVIDGSEDTGSAPTTDTDSATTAPLKEFPNQYDNPDTDVVLIQPSAVMTAIITTGVDPTTTTPGVVDDGAEPITAGDLAGAGPVGGLNLPVNPLVIDGTDEAGVTLSGDIGVRLIVGGPDVLGPNDPILGGAEPITADDLNAPPGGSANPIAGGEDEDLEDLEIQRFDAGSPRTSTMDWDAPDI